MGEWFDGMKMSDYDKTLDSFELALEILVCLHFGGRKLACGALVGRRSFQQGKIRIRG